MLSSPHSQHNQSVSSLQQQQQLQHQAAAAAAMSSSSTGVGSVGGGGAGSGGSGHIYSNQHLMLHHSNYSMESEEGDIEDNRPPSLSSSKSNLTENSSMDHHSIHSAAAMRAVAAAQAAAVASGKITPSMQKVHQFLVRTFSSPTKCNHCTSLMVSTSSFVFPSFFAPLLCALSIYSTIHYVKWPLWQSKPSSALREAAELVV